MKPVRSWHWLCAAVLSAVVAAPCIGLALREMERHQVQRALVVSTLSSLEARPVALASVRELIEPYRRAIVRGIYDHSHEVLIRGRQSRGESGFHVVTPLRVEDGAVLVLRGWIPKRSGGTAELMALAEAGEVAVEGFPLPPGAAVLGEEPSGIASPSPPPSQDSWPLRVDRLSTKGLAERWPYPIHRFVLQALPGADLPKQPLRLPLPGFDNPHANRATALYAVAACLAGLPFAGLAVFRRRE